jgi:GrpB-like predicted nucleotidyltransferase (UPF0157 family)
MVDDDREGPIGRYGFIRYDDPAAAFQPYDRRCPAVAARVIALIEARLPAMTVEHIGSTAVPACDGKGVIDLMLLYPPGGLEAAREGLDRLGFQPYTAPGAFGDDRPVRIGSIVHNGTTFRLHVHLLASDAPEVATQRRFRDALRADPALVGDYVARKRAILAAGITTSIEYNRGKEEIIRRAIGLPPGDAVATAATASAPNPGAASAAAGEPAPPDVATGHRRERS